MLTRLLTYIASQGGALLPAEAAAHLGVSPAMVEAMLETLVRLGYVTVAEKSCDARGCRACHQCGSSAACADRRLAPTAAATCIHLPSHIYWLRQRDTP